MARAVFPDALAGCVYTPEELGAEVDEAGEIKNVVAEQAPVHPIQTETTKSTVSDSKLGGEPQSPTANAPKGDLQAAIDRAKKGGPKHIESKPLAEPLIPLSWPDGQNLPSCMAAKVPFGKRAGTPLTDLTIEEALAMGAWIQSKAAAQGDIPKSWVEFYFSIRDYADNSPEVVTQDMFNPNGSARI